MADGSVPICRLCLEVVYDGRFEEAESIIISLQNVLPELNFSVSSHPLVCRKCIETLQKSFNFKATCLDNEKYVQNYKTNGGSTIYLEEVVQNRCTENEVKMEKIDKGKICRFCLQMLEGEACVQLGVIEENMLAKCLPELDLTVSENPVICGTCLECLQNQFNFVMSCLDVEERIQNYCSIQGTNSSGQVNLHDIVVLPVKTEVDTFSHNDTATGIREVKAELEATLNAKTEPSKMEYEEVFIKDEVGPEGTQEDSLSGASDSEYEMETEENDDSDNIVTCSDGGLTDNKDMVGRLNEKNKNKNDPQKDPFSYGWRFDTSWEPMPHTFKEQSGPRNLNLNGESSALDIFETFVPESFIDQIVTESNKHIEELRRTDNIFLKSSKKQLKLTSGELYMFLAVSMLMNRTKKLRISEYWSRDPLLMTPIFTKSMKRDRFYFILKGLHFFDNNTPHNGDKLHKVRLVVDFIRQKFNAAFSPSENLCLDESLLLFRGGRGFKQYSPSRRHKVGLRFFIICDSATGFAVDFIIYTGSSREICKENKDMGPSSQVVLTLMTPYLGKGHTLYINNGYSSPALANTLYSQKTNYCGTAKVTRKYMPKMNEKLDKGEMTFRTLNNMLVLKWCDKKNVHIISTKHDFSMKECGKKDWTTGHQIMKPTAVIEFNKYMGRVDKSDMISSIEPIRRSVKWYQITFFHLIDLCLLNSHVIFKQIKTHKKDKEISLAKFQLDLIRQLLEKYSVSGEISNRRGIRHVEHPLRLTGRHFISRIPKPVGGRSTVRRCYVCAQNKKRHETTYQCNPCGVGLCIPCFEIYHTKRLLLV